MKQSNIIRYAIQRNSDGKYYKNATAIYPSIKEYWTDDINKARLWIYEVNWDDWGKFYPNSKGYKTLKFELICK